MWETKDVGDERCGRRKTWETKDVEGARVMGSVRVVEDVEGVEGVSGMVKSPRVGGTWNGPEKRGVQVSRKRNNIC